MVRVFAGVASSFVLAGFVGCFQDVVDFFHFFQDFSGLVLHFIHE